MASKPLRFHPQAEQEYLTSLAWYRERSPIAAITFESAFEQAVARIKEAPHRWPIYFKDFRKYTLRQFPFGIVYQDFSSEIVVFAWLMAGVGLGTGRIGCNVRSPTSRKKHEKSGTRLTSWPWMAMR